MYSLRASPTIQRTPVIVIGPPLVRHLVKRYLLSQCKSTYKATLWCADPKINTTRVKCQQPQEWKRQASIPQKKTLPPGQKDTGSTLYSHTNTPTHPGGVIFADWKTSRKHLLQTFFFHHLQKRGTLLEYLAVSAQHKLGNFAQNLELIEQIDAKVSKDRTPKLN